MNEIRVELFRRQGYLVIRKLVQPEELGELRRDTLELVRQARRERAAAPDFLYTVHESTGEQVRTGSST